MRAWITDRWLTTADDGTTAPPAVRRALSRAHDPMTAAVPAKWRTAVYGKFARWRVSWYADAPDGKRVQRSRSFSSLSDAEGFQAALEDDIRRGRYTDPRDAQRSFRSVADAWLASKQVAGKSSTRARYRRDLAHYAIPRWGDAPISSITSDDIQKWVADLAAGTAPAALAPGKKRVPLSASSIAGIVAVATGGPLRFALERGWIRDDVMRRVTLPRVESGRDDMIFLTHEEVEAIADAAARLTRKNAATPADPDPLDERAGAIRLLAYTGMRIGEMLALRVGDVDTAARRIRIARTWSDGENGLELVKPKSGKSRSVAYPAFLSDLLRSLTEGRPADEWLLLSPRGCAWNVRNWRRRVWMPALQAAGLDEAGVTIHSLRHTFASWAIAAGCDVKTLQAQLGHASAAITLDVYAGLWPERLGEVADAVGAARVAALEKPAEK